MCVTTSENDISSFFVIFRKKACHRTFICWFLAKSSRKNIDRDDIGILLDGHDVRTFGSQGQQRTAALSMKLSELALMRNEKGEAPVLLLDDVLSELDGDRQRELLSSAFDCQCFLTTTSLEGLEEVPNMTVFECAGGKLARV